jgi:hypothetical protein
VKLKSTLFTNLIEMVVDLMINGLFLEKFIVHVARMRLRNI